MALLNFPIEFFDDEIRDGFYVPAIMKHNWAAQMEIVKVVDEICKKNNIKYYLFSGTLIGAMRHGGFIPWDDDMDICMLRKDYMRFVKAIMRDKPENYHVRNCHTDPTYRDVFTRLLNEDGIEVSPRFWEMGHGFICNAGIDIFPLDYIPSDSKRREEVSHNLMHFQYIIKKYDENGLDRNLELKLQNIEKEFKIKIKRDDTIPQQMYILSEEVMSTVSRAESKSVHISLDWAQSSMKGIPIECFKEQVLVPFETATFAAPYLYDKLLSEMYHNYMRSVRVCSIHNYPWYQAILDDFRKAIGFSDYPYKSELLPESDRHQVWENTLISELNEHLDVFAKASALAEKSIENGDMENGNILLEKCRILAENAEKIEAKLKSASNNRVIFLTWKAEGWKYIEPYYRKEVEAGNEVLVVPVPFRRLTETRTWTDEYIETEGFPEDVVLTDFSSIDYSEVRISRIYTQNPYDSENGAIALREFFHTVNIREYTDELIYVPWFELDEYGEDDERALYMMKFFVQVPGIVAVDKILIPQSQAWIRPMYIKKLIDWAGEGTKEIWENKIEIVDTNAMMNSVSSVIPDSRSEEQGNTDEVAQSVKTLLYYLGTGQVLADIEGTIQKLERNLHTFEASADKLKVKLFVEDGLKDNIEKYYPQLLKAFDDACKLYADKEWCEYIEATEPLDVNKPEIYELVESSTALYGDAGVLMHMFNRAKKPVMIQNLAV